MTWWMWTLAVWVGSPVVVVMMLLGACFHPKRGQNAARARELSDVAANAASSRATLESNSVPALSAFSVPDLPQEARDRAINRPAKAGFHD